jgi:hypothetical protein
MEWGRPRTTQNIDIIIQIVEKEIINLLRYFQQRDIKGELSISVYFFKNLLKKVYF